MRRSICGGGTRIKISPTTTSLGGRSLVSKSCALCVSRTGLQRIWEARRVLGEQLGIEPNAALRRLEEQILLEELPLDLPRADAVPTQSLPVRTSVFVGRREETAQV